MLIAFSFSAICETLSGLSPYDDTFTLTAKPSPCLIRCLSTWTITAPDHSPVTVVIVVVAEPSSGFG
jgi:hypothetical protein